VSPTRTFKVITLPPDNAALPIGRQRQHHALDIATDAPRSALRSLGMDASDCSVRLRLPSRLTPATGPSASARLDIRAQAGLACRF
jgi:hypothetical protein